MISPDASAASVSNPTGTIPARRTYSSASPLPVDSTLDPVKSWDAAHPSNRMPEVTTFSSSTSKPWPRICSTRVSVSLEASFVAMTNGFPRAFRRDTSSSAPGNGSFPSTNTPNESNPNASNRSTSSSIVDIDGNELILHPTSQHELRPSRVFQP